MFILIISDCQLRIFAIANVEVKIPLWLSKYLDHCFHLPRSQQVPRLFFYFPFESSSELKRLKRLILRDVVIGLFNALFA